MTRFLEIGITFLQKPFKENLAFFLKMWILVSFADVVFWSIHGNFIFGTYMGTHGFVYAYVIALVCNLLGARSKKIFQGILIALGQINLVADSFAHYIMHSGFSTEVVAIIKGTNPCEGSEFISMYLKPDIIIFILFSIALLPLIDWMVKKSITEKRNWFSVILSFILLFSTAIISIRHSKNWETVFLHKILLFTSYNPPKDLAPYRSSPAIQTDGDSPQIIALIIGESLSRNHCSLYGYDKPTTPRLSQMAEDSLIYTFDNVSAAYYNTGGVFPLIMSTCSGSDKDMDQWYNADFIEDITSSIDYRSVWISNQSSSGFYDNPIARIAELSDSLIWAGTTGIGTSKTDFDEIVIPPVRSLIEECGGNKTFFVVHLMGQHEEFSKRFPKEFKKLSAQDYMDIPANQRQVMADYDNAVLYGDWVVSELMRSFSEKEAIVFFFPDHALDIFDSDPTYAGHARPIDPQSVQAGLQIPFLIYTTESYRKHFPDKTIRLLNAVNKPYNTEDITYTIMDVANASFTNNPSLVKEKSLLAE